MSAELVGLGALALAIAGHAGALVYWAGRVNATLESLARRLELLELHRGAAPPRATFPTEYPHHA